MVAPGSVRTFLFFPGGIAYTMENVAACQTDGRHPKKKIRTPTRDVTKEQKGKL